MPEQISEFVQEHIDWALRIDSLWEDKLAVVLEAEKVGTEADETVTELTNQIRGIELGDQVYQRHAKEQIKGLDQKIFEITRDRLREVSEIAEERTTDEAYDVFSVWAVPEDLPEKRTAVSNKLKSLRNQIENDQESGIPQQKYLVLSADGTGTYRILTATAAPVIGYNDRDFDPKIQCVMFDAQIVIVRNNEIELITPKNAHRYNTWCVLDLEDIANAEVVTHIDEIEALRIDTAESKMNERWFNQDNVEAMIILFNARTALGLPNDLNLVSKLLEKYLELSSNGRTLKTLQELVVRTATNTTEK